jgi:hypothetical protein
VRDRKLARRDWSFTIDSAHPDGLPYVQTEKRWVESRVTPSRGPRESGDRADCGRGAGARGREAITTSRPDVNWCSHDTGHLLKMMFGWRANPQAGPFHLASFGFIAAVSPTSRPGWNVLYQAQRQHALATTDRPRSVPTRSFAADQRVPQSITRNTLRDRQVPSHWSASRRTTALNEAIHPAQLDEFTDHHIPLAEGLRNLVGVLRGHCAGDSFPQSRTS